MIEQKFPLGYLAATPGALDVLNDAKLEASSLLDRHVQGDWGDICEEDRVQNEWALENGARLMSVYPVGEGQLWVITEADRSATTILKPDEY